MLFEITFVEDGEFSHLLVIEAPDATAAIGAARHLGGDYYANVDVRVEHFVPAHVDHVGRPISDAARREVLTFTVPRRRRKDVA